jgi:hypothetical protein
MSGTTWPDDRCSLSSANPGPAMTGPIKQTVSNRRICIYQTALSCVALFLLRDYDTLTLARAKAANAG